MIKCAAIDCNQPAMFRERLPDGRIVHLCADCRAAVCRPWRQSPILEGDETNGADTSAGSDKRSRNRDAGDAAAAVSKVQDVAESPDGDGEV